MAEERIFRSPENAVLGIEIEDGGGVVEGEQHAVVVRLSSRAALDTSETNIVAGPGYVTFVSGEVDVELNAAFSIEVAREIHAALGEVIEACGS